MRAKAKPKLKSHKGKRHPVFAESLDNIAASIANGSWIVDALRKEAKRLRGIVR